MMAGGGIMEERMWAGEMKARYCVSGREKDIPATSVAESYKKQARFGITLFTEVHSV